MDYKGLTITKYPQSGFRIDRGAQVIYIDPFRLPDNQPIADVILLTHEHKDHTDPDSLRKIIDNRRTWIGTNELTREVIGELAEWNCSN